MKLLTSFFSAIVFLSLSLTGAFAQANKILVPGNPGLSQAESDAIVLYYERGLDISFSAAERRELQSLIVENWRGAQNAGAASGLSDFLGTVDSINAWDGAKRTRLQDKLREAVIGDLQATAKAGNDMSRFVLETYEGRKGRAAVGDHGNSDDSGPTGRGDVATGTGDLTDLIGEWVWGRSGSSTYAAGGALMGSNGSRFTYRFAANGSVEYTGIMNVMTGGCRMQVFTSKKGKARLSGDTLVIDWAPADFSRDDSCSPSKNYKKKLPAETESLKVRFDNSYGQKQLCITGKDETCFSGK